MGSAVVGQKERTLKQQRFPDRINSERLVTAVFSPPLLKGGGQIVYDLVGGILASLAKGRWANRLRFGRRDTCDDSEG